MLELVTEIVENLVNPALAVHEGSAQVLTVEEDKLNSIITVTLRMKAGCAGCPMSQTSTRAAIEELLAAELDTGVIVNVES